MVDGCGGRRGVRGRARVLRRDCVDIRKANLGRVEAVRFVDDRNALVARFGKDDVDALHRPGWLASCARSYVNRGTYRIQGGTVLGLLDNLNSGQVARLDAGVYGKRHLRQADGSGVRVVGRADDLEGLDHGVAHVHGAIVGSVGAKAQVDLDVGQRVAAEPARLEGDGAAGGRPVRSVAGGADAAA